MSEINRRSILFSGTAAAAPAISEGSGAVAPATLFVPSRAQVLGQTIAASVVAIQTSGYATPGDGGAALYIRRPENSDGPAIRSLDGSFWMLAERILQPEMFGAAGDGNRDDIVALERARDAMEAGSILFMPGKYAVSRTFVWDQARTRIDCPGFIVPSGRFDGFLLELDGTPKPDAPRLGDTSGVMWITQINLDCRYQCRGILAQRVDCSTLDNISVYRAYGTAIWLDRVRESSLKTPRVIGGLARQRFAVPDDWDPVARYKIGDRVRRSDPVWQATSDYRPGEIISVPPRRERYVCIEKVQAGVRPGMDARWRLLPHVDYEAMAPNINKHPDAFNTNHSSAAERLWRRVYQDEAVIEIVDNLDMKIDRSNQIIIDAPDIRDWNNLCGLRIDNVQNAAFITHVTVRSGHLHYHSNGVINAWKDRPEIVPQSVETGVRIVELQRVQNVYFTGCNIRMTSSVDAIGFLIGDGADKSALNATIEGVISGEGLRQAGIILLPVALPAASSTLDLRFMLSGPSALFLYGPNEAFDLRRQLPKLETRAQSS